MKESFINTISLGLAVDHKAGKPVYLQLMDGIKELAYSGRIGQGFQLPTVRTLAAALDINPNTVARAYRELEQEGLLNSRVGRGTFIAQIHNEDAKAVLARMQSLEREMASRCLELGLTEKQFVAYLKDGKRRK